MIKINGEKLEAAGQTLADFLAAAAYNLERIVVERNGQIVPKADYGRVCLADGDTLEIVSFVGGG